MFSLRAPWGFVTVAVAALSMAAFTTAAPAQTLYAVDSGQAALLAINSATGNATVVASTLPLITPAGVTSDGLALFSIDLANGALLRFDAPSASWQPSGSFGGAGWQDVVWVPAFHTFVGVLPGGQFQALAPGGTPTPLPITGGGFITALAVDAAGDIYTADFLTGEIGRVDLASLSVVAVTNPGIPGVQGMSFGPDGRLYLISSATLTLDCIDLTTGAQTPGVPLTGVVFPKGLTWDVPAATTACATVIGTGCAGSLGVPVARGVGVPRLGSTTFAISVTTVAPGQPGALYVSLGVATVPLVVGGCDVWLDPASFNTLAQAGLNPLLTFATDAAGAAFLPIYVPLDPALAGWHVGAQVLVIDPGAAPGFSLTNALDLLLAP